MLTFVDEPCLPPTHSGRPLSMRLSPRSRKLLGSWLQQQTRLGRQSEPRRATKSLATRVSLRLIFFWRQAYAMKTAETTPLVLTPAAEKAHWPEDKV